MIVNLVVVIVVVVIVVVDVNVLEAVRPMCNSGGLGATCQKIWGFEVTKVPSVAPRKKSSESELLEACADGELEEELEEAAANGANIVLPGVGDVSVVVATLVVLLLVLLLLVLLLELLEALDDDDGVEVEASVGHNLPL